MCSFKQEVYQFDKNFVFHKIAVIHNTSFLIRVNKYEDKRNDCI